ncbi:hypothetical protein AB0L13_38895 [Saccharopolyspora shandongensis]|uniref:hypothetical protein n=1 Tax=Saccharopolyspora shandongensis TaxID=418495 RepID=UPI003426813D
MLHEVMHTAVALLDQAPAPAQPPIWIIPPSPTPTTPTNPWVLPNPPPVQPNWSGKVVELVGNIRWLAGLALVACFFLGVIVWSAGRGIDHHRAGRIGIVMMLVGVFGGLAWALGYTLISYMAATG